MKHEEPCLFNEFPLHTSSVKSFALSGFTLPVDLSCSGSATTDRKEAQVVSYVHMLDGRLRLRLSTIKKNPVRAEAVKTALHKMSGVKSVKINLTTGSILVHFDEWQIDRRDILDLFNVPLEMRTSPTHSCTAVIRKHEIRRAVVEAVIGGIVAAVCQRMVGLAFSPRVLL